MAHLSPLPPSHTHTSTRLTHAQAHSFLATFLDKADSHPAYRPDSTLTPSGPVSTSAGSATNLTLAHLRRVLAGIKGERVGGAMMMQGEQDAKAAEEESERPVKRPRRFVEVDGDGEVVVDENAERDDAVAEGGWQEKDDFELEQEEVLAPLAEVQRDEQPQLGQGNGEVAGREETDLDVVGGDGGKKVMDKAERKKLKKQRAQEEKRVREDERRKKAK